MFPALRQEPCIAFVNKYYDFLTPAEQVQARRMAVEGISIFAAQYMCHPRDRIRQYDWSDVVISAGKLREINEFISKHELGMRAPEGQDFIPNDFNKYCLGAHN